MPSLKANGQLYVIAGGGEATYVVTATSRKSTTTTQSTPMQTGTDFQKIEKITATAPQPHRTVFKYFAIFKNVAHSLEPGETPSYSASHQAPNYVQRS